MLYIRIEHGISRKTCPMRKFLAVIAGVLIVAAIAWTGLWFYGQKRIVGEIETQAQLIRDRGGEVEYEDIEIGGFPLGYTGRIVAPTLLITQDTPLPGDGDASETGYRWSAPWVEARATVMAPRTIEFTFPERQDMVVTLPEFEEVAGQTIPMTLLSDALTITTTHTDDDTQFEGTARSIGTTATLGADEAGTATVVYTLRDFETQGRIDRRQASAAQMPVALTYTVGEFDSTMTFEGGDIAQGGQIALSGGMVEGMADLTGPMTVGGATIQDAKATLNFPSLGGQPMDVTIRALDIKSSIPSTTGPAVQDFSYRIDMRDLTVADQLWSMFDPEGAFTREINTVTLDMSGGAIFNVLPSDPDAFMMSEDGDMPVDIKTLTVNELTLDALGLHATGEASASLIDVVPTGTGELAVQGFGGIMNSLVRSGFIPPQQAMVVQLMVESFGRMDEDGETVRFDFEAKEGMIYVNGIPIGEAPGRR